MNLDQPQTPEQNIELRELDNPDSISELLKKIWEQLMSEYKELKQNYQAEKISRVEWRNYLDSHAVLSDSYKQFVSLYNELEDVTGFQAKMHYYQINGQILAFEYVITCDEAYEQKPFVFNFIGVMPSYQRQGLGYKLLSKEIEYLKTHDINKFKTGVWEGSEALYAKRKREVGDIDYTSHHQHKEILVYIRS